MFHTTHKPRDRRGKNEPVRESERERERERKRERERERDR